MLPKPDLISNIYDCAITETKWAQITDEIVSYSGARGALLGAVSVTGAKKDHNWALAAGSKCWRDIPQEYQTYMRKNYLSHQIKAWKILAEQEKFGYIFDNAVYSDDANLYDREDYVYRREQLGILRSISFRLNDDRIWFDTFVAHFSEEFTEVPESSQRCLAELVPHLSKSVELARTFGVLRQRYKAVLAALDHVSIGLCVVLPSRVVAVCNIEAQRIFAELGIIRLDSQEQLICGNLSSKKLLNEAIDKANNMPFAKPTNNENIFRIENSDGKTVLVETSHLCDSSGELGEPLNCCLVSIIDLSNTKNININPISKAYSLTSAEQATCSLLVDGCTNNEIAEHRNVSPETVKKQVSSIYNRTAVRNRTELIRLILKTSPPIITQ